MRWHSAQLVLLTVVLLAPARAGAEPPASQVLQFQLPASNGYTLQVGTEGTLAHISLWRDNREFATTYDLSEAVDGSEIDAELGSLGRIDVQFNPSGTLRTVPVGNSDCRLPRQLGSFTGTIYFRGENDYASVAAVGAPRHGGAFAAERVRGRDDQLRHAAAAAAAACGGTGLGRERRDPAEQQRLLAWGRKLDSPPGLGRGQGGALLRLSD